jgi:hypothetical protein
MKKNILKSLCLFFVMLATVACSDESNDAVQMNDASDFTVKSTEGDVWEGVIGVVNGKNFEVLPEKREAIIADLESILAREGGDNVKLATLEIVEKVATNVPGDLGYMIIGSNNDGISIGKMVAKSLSQDNNTYVFTLIGGSSGSISTSCWGCARGCFLRHYRIDGKFIPYCEEGVCGNFCTKKETEK